MQMFTPLKKALTRWKLKLFQVWQSGRQRLSTIIRQRPFASFFGLLLLLFVIIAIGHQLRKPPAEVQTQAVAVKDVDLFSAGAVPHMALQAKVEKSGVITVVAQAPGIVQKIRVKEGDHVKRGSQLLALSTNYQGGNVADVARQITQKNYQFLVDNYDTQKDALDKQRELAKAGEAQASQMRSITRQSLDETSSLINLDQTILDGLNKQIDQLKLLNVNGSSDSAILQLQQAVAGTTAGLNGARAALRVNQYQSDDSKEPAEITTVSRDLALRQLDLQQHSLDLNKDLAKLNVRVSQINESLMFPASPFAGTVERILVKVGQSVNPGTALFSLRGDKNTASAIILASADVAGNISRLEPTQFTIHGQTLSISPRSISQEPTDGNLHSIIYTLPDTFADDVTNNSYITANVPAGVNYAKSDDPFVPLDGVYQTQESAYILVAEQQDGKLVAKSKQVQLGQVFGKYVEVLTGMSASDQVILGRNVVEGDVVRAK